MAGIALADLSTFIAAAGISNDVDGDGAVVVSAVNTLEHAVPGELSFLANPKYRRLLPTTAASAVIVGRDAPPVGKPLIRCDDPYAAFTAAIVKIHGYRKHPRWGPGRDALIVPTAVIGAGANIAPGVTIGDKVRVGADVTLYPGVFIGDRAVLGDGVTLYPNVVVYDDCVLGDRVTVHACTVIGEDGLGYAPVGEKWVKIPQIGHVRIEDDVEIGANCSIDRATVGATVIGRGTKFSNLIAVGHGTRIGEDCLVVAQVGIAGSVTVGRHVTLAGQAGVVGHLNIGDNAKVGAKSGVREDVPADSTVLGVPAVPISEFKRRVVLVHKLPEMKQRIKDLEAQVAELRRLVQANGRAGAGE